MSSNITNFPHWQRHISITHTDSIIIIIIIANGKQLLKCRYLKKKKYSNNNNNLVSLHDIHNSKHKFRLDTRAFQNFMQREWMRTTDTQIMCWFASYTRCIYVVCLILLLYWQPQKLSLSLIVVVRLYVHVLN